MNMNKYETEAVERLRPYLAECTVLLKSDGSFPLDGPGKIGAYGSGIRHTLKGGTGSGEVNSRYFVTVEEGLENAGFTISSKNWLDAYDEVLAKAQKDFVKEIKQRAKEKHVNAIMEGMGAVMSEPDHDLKIDGQDEVAIYVVSRICGEGNDRRFVKGDFMLNDSEIRDIRKLNAQCPKFMLVLNVGGPVDLSDVSEVRNILVLSQLGVETGAAVADILLGKANPSGKLTTSWAKPEDYCTIGEFGNNDDTDYKEGIYVGYRYFDLADKKPLYPFGYGLSFSRFAHRYLDTIVDKDRITVRCEVENLGPYAGKQTIQLYVSCPEDKLNKPYQDLAAFAKTRNLEANEKDVLDLSFALSDIASYDEERQCYVLEKGDYLLRLGEDSVNTKVVSIASLDKDAVIRQVKNSLGNCGFKDYVFERKLNDDLTGVERYTIDAGSFSCETVEYKDEYPIREDVAKLSDEQLAYMNIGSFSDKGGFGSVVGNAAQTVAGAAGESCSRTGLKPLVMADGPAGLRISPLYYQDEKGIHSYGPSLPASMVDFMPWFLKFLGRAPKLKSGTILKEQYCTAIPIGTAIAQSFNEELACVCGDIVGREMEIFHVDIWLAPALNIHRSVLCGRNFEYYSEDPLISGKMAAAVTKGVHKHANKLVTIKHYAANNQETNRYATNSNISERALREIYLRGFEICIKEAKPLALMTSYNMINGVHTNEHYGLCTDVLRSEYGYDGLIMTDWEVSAMPMNKNNKYQMPDSEKCAMAGNNMYMPGNKGDYKKVIDAVRNKTLDRKVLERSASRIYDMVEKLKG